MAKVITSLSRMATKSNVAFEHASFRYAHDFAHLRGRGQSQTPIDHLIPLCGVVLNSVSYVISCQISLERELLALEELL